MREHGFFSVTLLASIYLDHLVHDSQVFMLREDTALDALKAVTAIMQECPFETCATFLVEAALGPTWADVKEIKV